MLELPDALPQGALCAASPAAAGPALQSALWWHGCPDAMQLDSTTGAVTRWNAQGSSPAAIPTEPNKNNGLITEIDTLFGLQCRAQTHCGLVAEAITENAATATLAIRFYTTPGDDARTLLTLNTGDNYLFLSGADGLLTAKDDQGRVSTDLPLPAQDAPHLAIVSLNGDHLALSLGDAHATATAAIGILSGPADLFIGCRNQRPRLLKTLGAALILDVWLFPGRTLSHTDPATKALQRHHLWASE
ncbi:hypothetical protein [Gymnodinialimonas ulvae]|uniref:hypothetical protein n=1 Tax=Gymnodinialimonas ulvae TaxID=3126504 RepID=UPI0030B7F175